ncbi:MAG: hypothetical protein HYY06_31940 [Deltaproteobacteria bacterium]|nr:hypothetical protein [Deltaproteobacteria bacterium]
MCRALAAMVVLAACGSGSDGTEDGGAGEPDAAGLDSGEPDARTDAGMPPFWSDDFPAPVAGNCEPLPVAPEAEWATGVTPEGAQPAGYVLPGGRRITPAGTLARIEGFPIDMVELAGDRLLVTDSSKVEHRLHLVDADTGEVLDVLGRDEGIAGLFHGLVVAADGMSGFAAGGGGGRSGIELEGGGDAGDPIYPFRVEDDALVLGEPIVLEGGYPSGLELSADGSTLLVALELAGALALIDVATGDEVGRVELGEEAHPYGVVLSPDGETAYVSLWAGDAVAVVSLASRTTTGSIPVGKNPESMLITPDAARLLVVNSDSDTLSVIDLASEEVALEVFLGAWPDAPFGAAPNNLALSDDGTRLFVTASGENAVDVLDPETFERIGRIPTAWYPTAVHPRADGSVVVLTSKGIGSGPQRDVRDAYTLMAGSVSLVPPQDEDALAAGAVRVDENNTRMREVHRVECGGAPYDFPIPSEPGQTSPIKRVVLIVRENKTYDSELGDLDGTNADPDLVLWREDETTQNLHALARGFANTDNFYSQAEQSVQGHLWTTAVATTDFAEKTWLQDNRGIPIVGLETYSTPEKGFFLEHVLDAGFDVVAYAEMLGRTFRASPYYDSNLPGSGLWNLAVPDRDRAEYISERILWEGFLPVYTYMSIHRNHTAGD